MTAIETVVAVGPFGLALADLAFEAAIPMGASVDPRAHLGLTIVSTNGIGGHVDTNEGVVNEGVVVGGRRRRRHSDEFKAEAVRACEQPGVSMAAVGLARGVDADLLRRWVLQRARGAVALGRRSVDADLLRRWVLQHGASSGTVATGATGVPAFIPLAPSAPTPQPAPAAPIRIEFRRGGTTVDVDWLRSAAADCAAWLRELLRGSASTPSGSAPRRWTCAPAPTPRSPVSSPSSVPPGRTMPTASPTGVPTA